MIRFDQVSKMYSGTSRPALNSVDLEILKGEFVFLVGASGSGKSSFLRLVLKEERPSKGKIHVLGQELNTLPSRKVPYFRRSLGVVFQDFRLLPQKTVFDNVAFTLQVIGKSKGFIQEAVPDVLKMVGLGGKQGRYPHELSGGEQQRVAIARAIVNKPAILLADEPTGNLDPATSAGIMSLLSTINANGTTVIMATHDSGIVDQMKRRVIELISGQVVRDERAGGYQTQAIPVQKFDMTGGLGSRTSLATARPPAPETKVEPAASPFEPAAGTDSIEIPVAPRTVAPAPRLAPESGHPTSTPSWVPVPKRDTPPAAAAAPAVAPTPAAPAAAPASVTPVEARDEQPETPPALNAPPPALNEPGRRA
ncbi:cell division ATP-binding protein FtsE [Lysinimonas soli]|uniref:Cell division ATP-binding protein FtsE n=1 Tax=Lysinimonas soli TaxID=1074233 RepID=A0ABW0NL20_9MICO